MSIELMSLREQDRMRESCRLAAQTLLHVGDHLRIGISTEEINNLAHEFILERNALPSPLNYRGFPKSVCTSINEVVCHGIPSADCTLKDGDIINVDITVYYPKDRGFHGDTSATFYIGEPSEKAKHLVEVTRRSLALGIAEVKPKGYLGDIGAAIQQYAERNGCSVVRDLVGHGIGRKFHMDPQVFHWGRRGTRERLRPGMVFTIEPMINLGAFHVEFLDDGWTCVTRDRSLSAQFEHTVLVTDTAVEILTTRDRVLKNSEDRDWVLATEPQGADTA